MKSFWLINGLLISLIFLIVAGQRRNVASRECFSGENALSTSMHPVERVLSPMACCGKFFFNNLSIWYHSAVGEMNDTTWPINYNLCRFNLSSDSSFICCCKQAGCNSQAYIIWYLDVFMRSNPDVLSAEWLQYIPIMVFTVILLVLTLLTYMILDCCVIQPHKGHYRIEISPEFCANLRGTKVLPYLTKGELKMVSQQIKMARSTELPEIQAIKKKPVIVGVYTYTTTATVTNRELGSVEIGRPAQGDPYMATLIRMIQIGPREMRFEGHHLLDIISKAIEIFAAEPTLLDVPVPCQIYGDIHGQYSDLLRWFHLNGWPPTTRCCFLGDYVDRGRHSIEVIVLLLLLKIVMPYDVFLCRGNHEDPNINRVYSFYAEVEARVTKKDQLHDIVFAKFMECFTMIPLACRIGMKVMGMHGGLSPKLESWDDILSIKRPVNFTNGTLACDLVWSDPDRAGQGYEVNFKRDRKNGIGYLFGTRQVLDMCKTLDVDLVVRGHQAPMAGYELFGQKFMTVFSAPGYRTSSELETNYGASMHLDENGKIIITRIGVDNHVRLLRELQKLDKGEAYTDMNKLVLKPKHEDDDGSDM